MSEPNGSAFKVVLAHSLKKHLTQLHEVAHARNLGVQFIEALKTIDLALRRDPTHFGDPLFRLPLLNLTVFMRAVFPVAVDGVHDNLSLVIVRGFRLMV